MRSRRLLTAALSAVLVVGLTAPAHAGIGGFHDVSASSYYARPVQWMINGEITTGTSPTTFSPDLPVSRGVAATFLWRMEGRPAAPAPHPFRDVTISWQQDPISWMAAKGITTGTSSTTYSPDRPITRGEFAALLWRLAGSPSAGDHPFDDVTRSWQHEPIAWMASTGITTGTSPSTFSPDALVTRAQVATFLYRYSGSPSVTLDITADAGPSCSGAIGFDGSEAALKVIDSAGSAPSGTTWDNNRKVLNVVAADVRLDRVLVKGGVDVYGGGTTRITNSVIEFGYGEEVGVLMRNSSDQLVLTGSTIRRWAGSTPTVGNGRGGVQISGSHTMTIRNNDISGLPDGMQLAGDDIVVECNYVHDLTMVGTYPNNTHNDGIQLYSGNNIRIAHNWIDAGAVAPYSNAALFFQGSSIGDVTVEANFLNGGGFPIFFENGRVTVRHNLVGDDYLYGNKRVDSGATVVEWTGNLNADFTLVTPPG